MVTPFKDTTGETAPIIVPSPAYEYVKILLTYASESLARRVGLESCRPDDFERCMAAVHVLNRHITLLQRCAAYERFELLCEERGWIPPAAE